jgi:hypothetical protein
MATRQEYVQQAIVRREALPGRDMAVLLQAFLEEALEQFPNEITTTDWKGHSYKLGLKQPHWRGIPLEVHLKTKDAGRDLLALDAMGFLDRFMGGDVDMAGNIYALPAIRDTMKLGLPWWRLLPRILGRRAILALGFAVSFAGSAALAATPSLTLNSASGPPTSTITVGGKLFGTVEAVDIYFDSTDLVLAVTSATGAFSGLDITVTASAVPGKHWITAVGRHTGLAAQHAFTVQNNWSEFRRKLAHTGFNSSENVLGPSTVGLLDLGWSAVTGSPIFSSPAVANGVVYVGSDDGELYAFNAATGALLWSAGWEQLFLCRTLVASAKS